eukprot:scaffold1330_cov240-Pinguiococcus_pyrenoidosus.AAC.13
MPWDPRRLAPPMGTLAASGSAPTRFRIPSDSAELLAAPGRASYSSRASVGACPAPADFKAFASSIASWYLLALRRARKRSLLNTSSKLLTSSAASVAVMAPLKKLRASFSVRSASSSASNASLAGTLRSTSS